MFGQTPAFPFPEAREEYPLALDDPSPIGCSSPARGCWLYSAAPVPSRPECCPMQGYDLLMIIVLVAAVVWGAWKGFAWQIASLGSLIASYVVALTFRQQLAQYINASPPWNMFL